MFRYIETEGSHYAIGQDIGESLRSEIARSLSYHFRKLRTTRTTLFVARLKKLQRAAQKYFPEYLDELCGIAAGAHQPFEKIIIFSFEEELRPAEKCTMMAVKTANGIFLGHNEDYDLPLPMYIIKAKPIGEPAFLSVANAGQFPGTVAGLNEYGIAYAGNSIDTNVFFSGVGKTYCLRSFLAATTLRSAVARIRYLPRTIGNNSILISGRENKIQSLEWSPHQLMIVRGGRALAHTNHFLTKDLALKQAHTASQDSKTRLATAHNLLHQGVTGERDIKKILSNHDQTPRSICAHGHSKTLASIIVNATHGTMAIANGCPCTNAYKKFRL